MNPPLPFCVYALCLLCLLTACAGDPLLPATSATPPMALVPANHAGIKDDRGRFREIFCGALESHGDAAPDYRPCEEALTRLGREPPAPGALPTAGANPANYLVAMVPGLGWQCMENWLDMADASRRHLAGAGYEIALVEVDALSSSANNARQIRDFAASLAPPQRRKPLILITYSKGTPDTMEALVAYPELAAQVVAVISIAGAVGGTPLADASDESEAQWFLRVPQAQCDAGDGGAIASLRTGVRRQWLAEHQLPPHIRYYSVVTLPRPERISLAVEPAWSKLSQVDGRNDSQLLYYDQLLPGSTLLAYINADHLAAAVPIGRQHSFLAATLFNHNDYPREVLLEALLQYVEADLAPAGPDSP